VSDASDAPGTDRALLAAMLTLATACGDDASVDSRGTDADVTTSTLQTTSTTTTGSTDADTTVAQPARTSTTNPPPASTRSPASAGVFGTVTAGPTCPVAQAENPCDPRPVDTDIEARSPTGTIFATTQTDNAGAYDLQLAPATYTLVATNGSTPLPRCTPVTATVTREKAVQANIDCDTGIR
jgi:hypothetical protein